MDLEAAALVVFTGDDDTPAPRGSDWITGLAGPAMDQWP
jgi:hypothetical protein